MKNSNLRAVVDDKNCYASGACIKVCQVQAIKEGPKRFPIGCGAVEFLPGKAVIDHEICNGCGDFVAVQVALDVLRM